MKRYIESERLCKDILAHSPQGTLEILHIIENQPSADVVGEILEFLKEIRLEYIRYDNLKAACTIRYVISRIKENYLEGKK